ncbi:MULTISPECIES: hypothetical protein [unclassified Streptomyces]|uniref:SCO2195 family GlnR-regulated protein n=1 Tax=unclassified Streptomyces TaxID=2593676 RepID=UPI0016618E21|nr:hypothetical protein [Streptomyces sp. CBMA29]MBD0737805.1 hypothetical protein [Streptomyces sp. CBMA29]
MPSESVHIRPALALRAVESFLLRGGQQTARRNAWAAVVEDRRRARDRREAQHEMDALVSAARGSALND